MTKNILEAENTLMAILNSTKDGVIVVNLKYNILIFNPSAKKLTAFSHKKCLGQPVQKFFKITNARRKENLSTQLLDRVLKKRKPVKLPSDTILISKNGLTQPVNCSGIPIKNKNGDIHGIIILFRNSIICQDTGKQIGKYMNIISDRDLELSLTRKATFHREVKIKELQDKIKILEQQLND